MDYYDKIYYTLIGITADGEGLPWMPNAFAPGSLCDEAYKQLIGARDRVRDRLGVEDEDPDLEEMLMEMDRIQHALCRSALTLRPGIAQNLEK